MTTRTASTRTRLSPEERRSQLLDLRSHAKAWDLLRQRRAKQQYGEDPGEAGERPESQVEGYLQ